MDEEIASAVALHSSIDDDDDVGDVSDTKKHTPYGIGDYQSTAFNARHNQKQEYNVREKVLYFLLEKNAKKKMQFYYFSTFS